MGRFFWHLMLLAIVVSTLANEGSTDQSNPKTTSEEPIHQTKSGPYVQRMGDDERCDMHCAIIMGFAFSYIALVFAIMWAIKECAVYFRSLDSVIENYFKEVAEYYRQKENDHKIQPQFYV